MKDTSKDLEEMEAGTAVHKDNHCEDTEASQEDQRQSTGHMKQPQQRSYRYLVLSAMFLLLGAIAVLGTAFAAMVAKDNDVDHPTSPPDEPVPPTDIQPVASPDIEKDDEVDFNNAEYSVFYRIRFTEDHNGVADFEGTWQPARVGESQVVEDMELSWMNRTWFETYTLTLDDVSDGGMASIQAELNIRTGMEDTMDHDHDGDHGDERRRLSLGDYWCSGTLQAQAAIHEGISNWSDALLCNYQQLGFSYQVQVAIEPYVAPTGYVINLSTFYYFSNAWVGSSFGPVSRSETTGAVAVGETWAGDYSYELLDVTNGVATVYVTPLHTECIESESAWTLQAVVDSDQYGERGEQDSCWDKSSTMHVEQPKIKVQSVSS